MPDRISTIVDGVPLSLSNLDRPLFPTGFTKGELISYYVDVSGVLIPRLRGRAVTRVRFPQGTMGPSFYEKHLPAGAPDWVETLDVATSAGTVAYVMAADRPTLVWLANLAAIELHVPQWRSSNATSGPEGIVLEGPDEPLADTLMIDLDPGPGIDAPALAKGAVIAATQLAELGLESLPKTSGNKGLQLSVPISPAPASQVYSFAASLARLLAARHPRLFTATMAKEARRGLVFLDFAQNLAARNTVCAYSVRGIDHPSVATPLTWEELARFGTGPVPHFSPGEVLHRLDRYGDVWADELSVTEHPGLPDPLT